MNVVTIDPPPHHALFLKVLKSTTHTDRDNTHDPNFLVSDKVAQLKGC